MSPTMLSGRIGRCLLALCVLSFSGIASALNHPGILHSAAELDAMRAAYDPDNTYWRDFDNQARDALQAVGSTVGAGTRPGPIATFECGRVFNDSNPVYHEACRRMVAEGRMAYTLALKWAISGDEAYGRASARLIRDWARTFRSIVGTSGDASQPSLNASHIAPQFANAAEILRHYRPGSGIWSASDTELMNTFLGRLQALVDAQPDGNNYNNLLHTRQEARMAIGVFRDDEALYQKGLRVIDERIPTTIYLRDDGAGAIGPSRIGSRSLQQYWKEPYGWGQSNYANRMPDGLEIETCRDINHADMGFRTTVYAAKIALNQGTDLFTKHGRRMVAFLELHNKLQFGFEAIPVCANNPNRGVWCRSSSSFGAVPNCEQPETWYMAYNQLANRLGYDIPFTRQGFELAYNRPPSSRFISLSKWESIGYASNIYRNGALNVQGGGQVLADAFEREQPDAVAEPVGEALSEPPVVVVLEPVEVAQENESNGSSAGGSSSNDQNGSTVDLDVVAQSLGGQRVSQCTIGDQSLYSFRNRATGRLLAVKDGNALQQGTLLDPSLHVFRAVFQGHYKGDPYYQFQHLLSGQVLEAEGHNPHAGTNVIVGPARNLDSTKYRLVTKESGTVCQLMPLHSRVANAHKCVGPVGGQSWDGVNVQLSHCSEGIQGRWSVEQVQSGS